MPIHPLPIIVGTTLLVSGGIAFKKVSINDQAVQDKGMVRRNGGTHGQGPRSADCRLSRSKSTLQE